ncbi:MAG: hypothetical protein MZW92_56905 [Comamonadaceae bacterium]|nr:hypothetical protein [Comamonadaceae bacterium]
MISKHNGLLGRGAGRGPADGRHGAGAGRQRAGLRGRWIWSVDRIDKSEGNLTGTVQGLAGPNPAVPRRRRSRPRLAPSMTRQSHIGLRGTEPLGGGWAAGSRARRLGDRRHRHDGQRRPHAGPPGSGSARTTPVGEASGAGSGARRCSPPTSSARSTASAAPTCSPPASR